jgi:hypothetical protein
MRKAEGEYATKWKEAQKRISETAEKLDLGTEFRMVFTTFEGYPKLFWKG